MPSSLIFTSLLPLLPPLLSALPQPPPSPLDELTILPPPLSSTPPYTLCLPPPHPTSPFPALPDPNDCRLAYQSIIPPSTPDSFVLTTDTRYAGQKGFIIANNVETHGNCAVSVGLVRKDLVTVRKRDVNGGAGGLIRGCLLGGGEGKGTYGGIEVWMAGLAGTGQGGEEGGGNIVYVEMGFWDGESPVKEANVTQGTVETAKG